MLHEVVKTELIRHKISADLICPKLGESAGELDLAGFFKCKNQDISVIPNHLKKAAEILNFEEILYGQTDNYGFDFTEQILTINVRSQYERVCLLIVDFSKDIPKIYHTDEE